MRRILLEQEIEIFYFCKYRNFNIVLKNINIEILNIVNYSIISPIIGANEFAHTI